jgi:hypothetical protein
MNYYILINLFFMQQLVGHLTRDFIREGWLYKTGPRSSDAYKKRWFTLDNRKLMYHDDPLVRDKPISMKIMLHCSKEHVNFLI